jgi:hypothetical protein
MNGLMELWTGRRETGGRSMRILPAPWEGDWRLAIAEERVAAAQAKLAAAEQRLREMVDSTKR